MEEILSIYGLSEQGKREVGCVDLSMDTMQLKYALVPFGSVGSALAFLSLLLHKIIMLCHCSLTKSTTFW